MKQPKQRFHQRLVILPSDMEVIRGYSPRGARNFILNLKKKLGKSARDFIFIHELCKALHTDEAEIRKHMRTPLLYFFFTFAVFYIFRDDMDLWLLWFLDMIILQLHFLWVRRFLTRARNLLFLASLNK